MMPLFRILLMGISLFCFIQPMCASELSQEPTTQNTAEIVQQEQSAKPIDNSWLSWISDTMTQTNSLAIRLLLVFFLGLLMSLTPCIYPMIPITAGILQAQSSKSLLTSFLLALSYTIGIATTFAILGLLAAFAGQAMGQFMSHPAFIIPLVGLLAYLALAMMGVYDMYIPRFMQPRNQNVHGGSFISAFTFGAISGIVASPCLSPGLLCLLCLVTMLNSSFLGFILLFTFGIGLSVPLLIIGTFSSSLALLPRSGMWMVEIKKLFGFLMLGMCLYFLNYIIPWHIMCWILVVFTFTIGLLFMNYGKHAYNRQWKIMYGGLGILLCTCAGFLAFKAYQWHQTSSCAHEKNAWQTDYECAREEALAKHTLVFMDIGAPFCSICKAIDTTLFSQESIRTAIDSVAIPVKIDGSNPANAMIIKKYQVLGFPTILLINPESEEIIKKWGPELYDIKPEQFISEVKSLVR